MKHENDALKMKGEIEVESETQTEPAANEPETKKGTEPDKESETEIEKQPADIEADLSKPETWAAILSGLLTEGRLEENNVVEKTKAMGARYRRGRPTKKNGNASNPLVLN